MLLHDEAPERALDGKTIDSSHRMLKSNKLFSSYSPENGIVEKWNISKILYPFGKTPSDMKEDIDWESIKKHLLDQSCIDSISQGNVGNFLNERSKIVAAKVSGLTGCSARYVVPAVFDVYSANELAEGEDEAGYE